MAEKRMPEGHGRLHHYAPGYHWSHLRTCDERCAAQFPEMPVGEKCGGQDCEVFRQWAKT